MKKLVLSAFVCLAALPAYSAPAELNTPQLPAEFQTGQQGDEVGAQRRFVCYARSLIGRTFYAYDWNLWRARQKAVNTCNRFSIIPACRLLGCERRF